MAECRNCIQDYGLCGDCYEGSLYKGMNNANRIRNMSDEELAEYLSELIRNAHEYHTGEGDWLQWLKSEAKD